MKRIWIDRARCLGCKTCELQCAVERNSLSRTLPGAAQESPLPMARVKVGGTNAAPFPLQCRHCEDAPCLTACPSGALRREETDGLISLNQEICRGCWMCVMSCPFGVVMPSAAYNVAVKCDSCLHMDRPACVEGCPTNALSYGDEADFSKILAKRRESVALWVNDDSTTSKPGVSLDCFAQEDNHA